MHNGAGQIDDPPIYVVRNVQGERINDMLAELLNPVDPKTFHQYRLPANTDVELHFHNYDGYLLFPNAPRITLRSSNSVTRQCDLGPGDMIACVRSVEHTLWADHELVYYRFFSVLDGDKRQGHLTRRLSLVGSLSGV